LGYKIIDKKILVSSAKISRLERYVNARSSVNFVEDTERYENNE